SFASSIATRLMYVGRILPNDSLRVRFGRPSKGSAIDKGSPVSDDAPPRRLVARSSVVRRTLCGQLLNTNLGYARLRVRPHRSPGASEDGRIAGERGIPEEFQQLHRPHPERARRDARVPQLLLRRGPRTGRDRPARRIRILLIRRLSRSAYAFR